MKLVILAGGTGSRMFPIVKPKPLLKFLGKSLLEWQMEKAAEAGFKDFIIVGNPENMESIKKATEGFKGNYNIQFAVQEKPKGMGNALLQVEDLIRDESILILNPNDLFKKQVYENIKQVKSKTEADGYIVGYEVEEYFPGGYLVVDEERKIQEIEEKPGKGNEPSNLVNLVIHLHKKPEILFKHLKQIKKHYSYEAAIDKMIQEGHEFQAVPYDGYWSAIKYPWDILKAKRYFLKQRLKERQTKTKDIAETAKIEGKVYLGEDVKVFENAVIRGPAYIGEGCIIGNNSLIRGHSHIGAKSVIGFSTEVKNCYIGKDCWFHSNYLGDSIISDDCSFGAGAITANLRFDQEEVKVKVKGELQNTGRKKMGCIIGQGSQLGVNVSLMPGVKVGPYSTIGPSVTLYKDIGANKYCYKKDELKVKENKTKSPKDMGKLRKKLKKLDVS